VSIRNFPLYEDDVEWWLACNEALDANRRYQGTAAGDEAELVAITNDYRMMLGRKALAINDLLVRAARGHSEEMSRMGYFAHESPVPRNATPSDRARNEGYAGSGIGENIARGKVGAQASHDLWLRSPPHHRNILGTDWTEQGTGRSGNGLIGYGELIIVKHSDRMLSAYAHNRKRLVSEGQTVAAGELLAEMGRDERNQALLHFEVRVNGAPQDPMKYLPKR